MILLVNNFASHQHSSAGHCQLSTDNCLAAANDSRGGGRVLLHQPLSTQSSTADRHCCQPSSSTTLNTMMCLGSPQTGCPCRCHSNQKMCLPWQVATAVALPAINLPPCCPLVQDKGVFFIDHGTFSACRGCCPNASTVWYFKGQEGAKGHPVPGTSPCWGCTGLWHPYQWNDGQAVGVWESCSSDDDLQHLVMGVVHCASPDDQEQAQLGAYWQVFNDVCSFQACLASFNVLWVHSVYCQRGWCYQNIQQAKDQSRSLWTWLHIQGHINHRLPSSRTAESALLAIVLEWAMADRGSRDTKEKADQHQQAWVASECSQQKIRIISSWT